MEWHYAGMQMYYEGKPSSSQRFTIRQTSRFSLPMAVAKRKPNPAEKLWIFISQQGMTHEIPNKSRIRRGQPANFTITAPASSLVPLCR